MALETAAGDFPSPEEGEGMVCFSSVGRTENFRVRVMLSAEKLDISRQDERQGTLGF